MTAPWTVTNWMYLCNPASRLRNRTLAALWKAPFQSLPCQKLTVFESLVKFNNIDYVSQWKPFLGFFENRKIDIKINLDLTVAFIIS